MKVGDWGIYVHPLLLDQLETLSAAAERAGQKDPQGYVSGRDARMLAAVLKLAFEGIAADPGHKRFEQGGTTGPVRKHWRLSAVSSFVPLQLGGQGDVCLIKTRRHPAQASALAAAFRLRERLAIEEAVVDHDDTLELAAMTELTAYDAGYLWLSRKLGADLVTLDRRLASVVASKS